MAEELPYQIVDDEHSAGRVLLVTGPWSADCALRLKLGDLQGVRLSYSAGFRGADLSFLADFADFADFADLRSVEVYSHEVKDLSPLASLSALELVGLVTKAKTKLRAEWFTSLRVALIQWQKGMEGLLECKHLEYLNAVNYPFADITPLEALTKLERLSLTSRKLVSLNGIEILSLLRDVDLYACPYLTSTEPLDRCPNIVRLRVESCRHIADARR